MSPKYEFHIDPNGQQPSLWDLYTQITFCYPLADQNPRSREVVLNTLKHGLQRLAQSFPWTAGQVIKQSRSHTLQDPSRSECYDYYVITPFEETPKLVVRDASDDLPDLDTYVQKNFPISLLDEDKLAPRKTKSASLTDESDPKPVFMVQITFIEGGLFLTFVGQHGTMDMGGLAETIRLLSKACHGDQFTEEELYWGNRDRREVVPLLMNEVEDEKGPKGQIDDSLPQSQQQDDSRHYDTASAVTTMAPPSEISPSCKPSNIWTYFNFSTTSLKSLKTIAVNSIPTRDSVEFVSTDDALSAFIWQSVTRSRLPRYNIPSVPIPTSTFARTVDVRRLLNIPLSYPGNLASKTMTAFSMADLALRIPLGEVAASLRSAIDPRNSDLSYAMRAKVTSIIHPSRHAEGESKGPSRPARDLSRDIAFSSWSKFNSLWSLDFNLESGQSPLTVRRPSFSIHDARPGGNTEDLWQPMEGVIYLMPKSPAGDIAVAICLRDDDMLRLRADKDWREYAGYIG